MTQRAKTPDVGANSFALARDGRTNSPLHNAIRNALAGSSSQQPVDTGKLYPLGTRAAVKAALMELYQAREVYCCKHIKCGQESVVWWLVGGVSAPHSFGRTGRSAAA